jgi:hypothetical protein
VKIIWTKKITPKLSFFFQENFVKTGKKLGTKKLMFLAVHLSGVYTGKVVFTLWHKSLQTRAFFK